MSFSRVLVVLSVCSLIGIWGALYQASQRDLVPLLVADVTPTPVATPEPTPTPSPTPATATATLVFGGDVMLGRTVESRIKQYGPDWPFDSIAVTLRAADYAVVNLESPLRTDASQTETDSLVLRGYPPGLTGLSNAGIDLVSLANNHIPDMGKVGLTETLQLLVEQNISGVGAGPGESEAAESFTAMVQGLRVGFLSYTYGVNFNSPGVYYNVATPERVTADVATLKPTVDAVIVLCHCGSEYQLTPNATQKAVAHAAIDAGASLYVGHHPHVPQPVEAYGEGLILYSLGNLIFDQLPGNHRDHSALAQVTLTGDKPVSLKLVPYHIHKYGQPRIITDEKESNEIWDIFKLPGGVWP